jgi:hypothetical protein
MIDSKKLKEPFNKKEVQWRAQTVTKNGDKALALAYIDSRAVMDRLDSVVGAENWKDEYLVQGSRVVCTLSIWDSTKEQWIAKSDGAGDTAVEAEKGGISDAFKRAAVKWGVGRYLYDFDAVWVPCETYNGKFKKFTADPWAFCKNSPKEKTKVEQPIPDKILNGVKKILEDIPKIHDIIQITETLEGKQYQYIKANYPQLLTDIDNALQQKQNELNGAK